MRALGMAMVLAGIVLAGVGCPYSTQSGLPGHVRTVEVPTFKARKTFYRHIEGKLTRRIKELVNLDPQVRVVNHGGDAVIEGEILGVDQATVRETKQDRPASVRLSITVTFSFTDEIEQRPLIQDQTLSSSQVSSVSGLYEVDRGEVRATAEDDAIDVLAREIVRRTLGMWKTDAQ